MSKRKPCSEATKAKISAAMRGNKNGRPHRKTVSARALNSLRAMDENRAARIHQFLAENPAADAARKARIAASVRAAWRRKREEEAKAKADREAFWAAWGSLSRCQQLGLIQAWNAPHDVGGKKLGAP